MKNILLATALIVVSAGAANAQINAVIGINQPAYAPVYAAPVHPVSYYNDRQYDWGYWRPAPRPVVVRNTYVYDNDRYDDHRGHKHGRGHGHGHDHH